MTLNTLLIGCGYIGGLADITSEEVSTWAKALSNDPEVEFSVYDENKANAGAIADKYSVPCLDSIEEINVDRFDFIVIATPTNAHHNQLMQFFKATPKLIVVEKPIASSLSQLEEIEIAYNKSNKRVVVNFHRRFQPGFYRVRDYIETVKRTERCSAIVVKYQRGFHNNASHAVDLLEFLFQSPISYDNPVVFSSIEDEIVSDPTIHMVSEWHDTTINWIGLAGLKASHLEIDCYFESKAIRILDAGDKVQTLSAPQSSGNIYPKFLVESEQSSLMADYMKNVLDHVKNVYRDTGLEDNFIQSLQISRRIIQLQERNKCQS